MRSQVLLLASLAMLSASTALPNPEICPRQDGVYDVCDTNYSFIRCNGHETTLIADCRAGPSTYCHIVNDRGFCNGTAPPNLGGTTEPCETGSSYAVASASSRPM
ncbi:hypothetical protein F5Y08DRAFT_31987 [Xylaria arbuscula]|nr:hypothetical protein F5Y08DRAFT_31987 [Xylaria arbuscula]